MSMYKKELSFPRQKLLEHLQSMNFGQVRQLHIKHGEPQQSPPPVLIKDWKLDGENEPRPELELKNFPLKQHHQMLFEILDTIGDGVIDEIHVRYGLPCRVLTSQLAR